MVGTGLVVELREDSVALAVLNLAFLFQSSELPTNEWVEVRVSLRGDKTAAPVSEKAEILQILLTLWGEELNPVLRILEFGNFLLGESKLSQDLVLSQLRLFVFRVGLN